MPTIYDLFEVRAGQEASTDWGTAVAQTVKWMGITECQFNPIEESEQIKDKRGSLQPGHLSVHKMAGAEGSIGGVLMYEDAPYLFDMLISEATPSLDTDVYHYDYTAPDGAETTPAYYTIAKGDGTNIYSMLGSTGRALTIQGGSGAPLTWTMDLVGKEVSSDTFDSNAEADRAVTTVMGDHVSLFIDPSSDAAGTTEISNVAFNFTLNYNTNRIARRHMGSLTPTGVHDQKHTGTLGLVLEVDSVTAAYLDAILNTSTTVFERVFRISAGDGTRLFRFDFNGVALKSPVIFNDLDGITTYELEVEGQYHGTLANWFSARVTSLVSSLP